MSHLQELHAIDWGACVCGHCHLLVVVFDLRAVADDEDAHGEVVEDTFPPQFALETNNRADYQFNILLVQVADSDCPLEEVQDDGIEIGTQQ